jgi:hypothetical protein
MLDEVIEIYAQYHDCCLPKDKIYGFLELVPQWKNQLVVDYGRSNLEVFLDVCKLGLIEQGGWHAGFLLWLSMGLEESETFSDCIRHYLP